jgi:DMSO/TMAO reductase YedYZ molybdopterin-dependent catalytic subunit
VALALMLSSSAVGVLNLAASGATDTTGFDSEWRLKVDGLVDNPLDLSISDLAALPQSVVYAELYCYGNLVASGDWVGVRLGLLLEKAGYNYTALGVEFLASDDYKMGLSITDLHKNLIIAYEINGQPLPEKLRLVLPGENGAAWIALITQITVKGLDPVPVTPSSPSNSLSPQEPSAPQESPNSQPAATPQPSATPQPETITQPEPVLTPQQPENQSAAEPAVPSLGRQPVTQVVGGSGSGLNLRFGYALVAVIVAVLFAVAGYLILKRDK